MGAHTHTHTYNTYSMHKLQQSLVCFYKLQKIRTRWSFCFLLPSRLSFSLSLFSFLFSLSLSLCVSLCLYCFYSLCPFCLLSFYPAWLSVTQIKNNISNRRYTAGTLCRKSTLMNNFSSVPPSLTFDCHHILSMWIRWGLPPPISYYWFVSLSLHTPPSFPSSSFSAISVSLCCVKHGERKLSHVKLYCLTQNSLSCPLWPLPWVLYHPKFSLDRLNSDSKSFTSLGNMVYKCQMHIQKCTVM